MGTKRENLMKKIKSLEETIAKQQSSLDEKKRELADLDKTELYQAATKNGFTVAQAIEKLSSPKSSAPDVKTNIEKELKDETKD
jgi:hypothetical protein